MNNAMALPRTLSGLRDQKMVGLIAQVLVGSLLMALSAQISIRLPFSPVPISLQSAMAIALGICFGPRAGLLAVATYLAEGAMGLPVFASGHAGLHWLFGPSGGYLIGFMPAAYVAGMVARHGVGRLNLLLAYFVGSAALYAIGMAQLACYVGAKSTLFMGLLPFIPGDVVKAVLCASLIRR